MMIRLGVDSDSESLTSLRLSDTLSGSGPAALLSIRRSHAGVFIDPMCDRRSSVILSKFRDRGGTGTPGEPGTVTVTRDESR